MTWLTEDLAQNALACAVSDLKSVFIRVYPWHLYPRYTRDRTLDRIRQSPEFTAFLAEMKAENDRYRRDFSSRCPPAGHHRHVTVLATVFTEDLAQRPARRGRALTAAALRPLLLGDLCARSSLNVAASDLEQAVHDLVAGVGLWGVAGADDHRGAHAGGSRGVELGADV